MGKIIKSHSFLSTLLYHHTLLVLGVSKNSSKGVGGHSHNNDNDNDHDHDNDNDNDHDHDHDHDQLYLLRVAHDSNH